MEKFRILKDMSGRGFLSPTWLPRGPEKGSRVPDRLVIPEGSSRGLMAQKEKWLIQNQGMEREILWELGMWWTNSGEVGIGGRRIHRIAGVSILLDYMRLPPDGVVEFVDSSGTGIRRGRWRAILVGPIPYRNFGDGLKRLRETYLVTKVAGFGRLIR